MKEILALFVYKNFIGKPDVNKSGKTWKQYSQHKDECNKVKSALKAALVNIKE